MLQFVPPFSHALKSHSLPQLKIIAHSIGCAPSSSATKTALMATIERRAALFERAFFASAPSLSCSSRDFQQQTCTNAASANILPHCVLSVDVTSKTVVGLLTHSNMTVAWSRRFRIDEEDAPTNEASEPTFSPDSFHSSILAASQSPKCFGVQKDQNLQHGDAFAVALPTAIPFSPANRTATIKQISAEIVAQIKAASSMSHSAMRIVLALCGGRMSFFRNAARGALIQAQVEAFLCDTVHFIDNISHRRCLAQIGVDDALKVYSKKTSLLTVSEIIFREKFITTNNAQKREIVQNMGEYARCVANAHIFSTYVQNAHALVAKSMRHEAAAASENSATKIGRRKKQKRTCSDG